MLYTQSRCDKNTPKITPNTSHQLTLSLGITLIELMVSIGVTSILITIALPSFNDFIVKLRVDNEISRLARLLLAARNHAINMQDNVIICPLKTNGVCSVNWHDELSVFVDSNNNKKFDSANNELLLATKSPINSGDSLKYATNRNRITYQATGHLFGLSNGTLKYCPKGYEEKSRGIVIARSGRFYTTTDNNNDGQDETRSHQKIVCD
ncbi:GspH/FimT family pseudopilin [Colwellia psychrerythraea]|uniref:Type II secretion system protein H n=1 Tax=Colwellia psychrerythraea TaxID=28229 RepID=A0A099KRM7_COLPS|nr:GspH/FimT family pseudopilin [Colwellia psychrerythraea]KGJ93414.1 General secretion pathway, GspH [Colwellia psychrerythraea]